MTDEVESIVIGAGVVGLAVARELAMAGHETVIVERHDGIGTEASSRNSEVIHAGLYYPHGSLKARLCVRGKQLLYDYCAARAVDHRRCGKLIVATSEAQLSELDHIEAAASRNGVIDLCRLSRREALALEPELACVGALLSPSTGIIDSHGLMTALLGDAERHGAMLALGSLVTSARLSTDGIDLFCHGEPTPVLRTHWLINCAGLGAVALARTIKGFPAEHIPDVYLAKGNYFSLAGLAPFSRLVYPVPEPGGLGVHLTLDLDSRARFGPDVEWVHDVDYAVDVRRSDRFYDRIRAYWPGIQDGSLAPAYSGIRAKISGPGEPAVDFRIDGPSKHGVPGIINLFGIESPGLTASMAIAEVVAAGVSTQ